jgi:hypothetical protein
MKKLIFIMFFLSAALSFAQQKYALVIGNGNYSSTDWRKLPNPANDASDMKAALEKLGFQVEHVINGNLDQMERAVTNFRRKLNNSRNSYGFFFYAGHGVQHQGENYLIPIDANIPSRNSLPQRALSVSFVLKELEDAENELNIIVIDACREFLPDSWDKDRNSATRGLAPIQVPRGSIVSFATAANSVAADGDGRNGLYTGFLLKHIATPGLDVNEVFRRTGSDVERATGGKQYPETRYMYHEIVYLGSLAQSQSGTYKIGDRGPAGGIIFYDKGNTSGGWRYLEAAPVSTEFKAQWGAYEKNVSGTSAGIGTGKRNTQLIVDFLKTTGENGKTAQLCANLNSGGFNDWFLPSKDELDLIYKNLKNKNIGDFSPTNYWSSSQYNPYVSWFQNFSDGYQNYASNLGKSDSFSVRAIRSF